MELLEEAIADSNIMCIPKLFEHSAQTTCEELTTRHGPGFQVIYPGFTFVVGEVRDKYVQVLGNKVGWLIFQNRFYSYIEHSAQKWFTELKDSV